MSQAEVKARESLPLDYEDSKGVMAELVYRMDSRYSPNAEVYYLFPQNRKNRLSVASYLYELEQPDARERLTEYFHRRLNRLHGKGKPSTNSNLPGYVWTEQGITLINDPGSQAVVIDFFDPEYLRYMYP
ncbi:hypothetical protein KIH86_05945 [Paenibacillus sp. HN-1]|nr:hypothetical protein [Paenibacillus sinensis]MBY9078036.1 hypothetical protein [Paenibacillus sp. CGMCC 1.18879]MBY9083777.1 hypothetical protein [Paenibacillus sinensis]